MTRLRGLAFARALHTLIYLVMAAATLVLLYGGVSGRSGAWLWVSGALLAVESVVFTASGMRCPLTAVVARCADGRPGVSDTYLPERMTRHTLTVFGPLMVIGFALIAWRLWRGDV